MFFNRGECGACALHGDIVVDNDCITLLLRDEKGKKALGAGRRSVRQIPCSKAPRFAALLRAFFAGQHSMKGRNGQRLRRWSLGPTEDSALWSADTVSGWLLLACNVVQCHPPRRLQLDVAQPPQRGCFRCQRHWCSLDGHPLRWRMVHQLHCHGSEVHRLRDAADSGSSHILWLPVQVRAPHTKAVEPLQAATRPRAAHCFGRLSPRGCSSSKWSLRQSK